jgi:hypothetical protein
VEFRAATKLPLAAAKPRQHVCIGPPDIAELAPVIEILALATNIDHAVDRAGSTEHLAAWPLDLAAVQLLFGAGGETPVEARIVDQLEDAAGNVNPQIVVAPASLEQQHSDARVGAQAVGQHASGRAGTDDHIIIAGQCGFRSRLDHGS